MDKTLEYDIVAYPGQIFSRTNPERLAALASTYGIAAAAPERCRVLELGCGDGLNLLSQAYCFPESEFHGIDLSSTHVEYGTVATRRIGIKNSSLRRADILELEPNSLGKFDYIVAHGLYSWVPPEVREKALELYRECLADNGIGYISFNAYPGCRMREMLWDGLRYFTRGVPDVNDRVKKALTLGKVMERSMPDGKLYKAVYEDEVGMLFSRPAPFVLHDDLSPALQSFYFHEFAEHLESNDLQFVCESDPGASFTGNLNETALSLIESVGPDLIAREQIVDFIKCRRFRSSLICRRSTHIERALPPDMIERFLIAADLTPADPSADLLDNSNVKFKRRDSGSLTTDEPFLKNAVYEIGKVWPRTTSFAEVVTQLRRVPELQDGFDTGLARAKDSMKQLYWIGLLKLSVYEPAIDEEVPEKPRVSEFARFQVEQDLPTVCTLDGSVLDADDPVMRQLIFAANGERNRNDIIEAIAERIEVPTDQVEDFRSSLPDKVDKFLEEFRVEGLLLREDDRRPRGNIEVS